MNNNNIKNPMSSPYIYKLSHVQGEKKSGIGDLFSSEAGSNLPSATAGGHNVYPARDTRVMGNNQKIGRETIPDQKVRT